MCFLYEALNNLTNPELCFGPNSAETARGGDEDKNKKKSLHTPTDLENPISLLVEKVVPSSRFESAWRNLTPPHLAPNAF